MEHYCKRTPEKRNTSVKNFLTERKLAITSTMKKEMVVTMRVPQESVLGPTLLNVLYDEVLKQRLPERAIMIGFIDD